jgi:hypothetical protein
MKIWQPCAKVVRELKRRAGRAENKKKQIFFGKKIVLQFYFAA